MWKRTQHVTSINVGGWWPTILLPFARAKSLTGSNFAQQLPTTRNNMQQGVQTDATPNNVASVSKGLLKGDALMNSPLNEPVLKEALTNEVQKPPSHDFDSHLLT